MKCMNHLTLEMITVFDTNSDMWVTEHVHDGVEARWEEEVRVVVEVEEGDVWITSCMEGLL